MYLGQEYNVAGNWFIIHFTENNGMAFGMEFGGQWGKYFLSVFRIIAVGAIFYYLIDLTKREAPKGTMYTALVQGGRFRKFSQNHFRNF